MEDNDRHVAIGRLGDRGVMRKGDRFFVIGSAIALYALSVSDRLGAKLTAGNLYVTIRVMDVRAYLQEDGSNPFQKWFQSLNAIAAAKVSTAIVRLELGNTSSIKWFNGIGEYRINWGPGYRIYLAQDGDQLIVLLGGGTKQQQQSDIKQAIKLWQAYQRRKKA